MARARGRWMREQGMFDAAHLVFIDETAADTKMVRLSGRCARGKRLMSRFRTATGKRSPSWALCAATESQPHVWLTAL